MKASRILLLCLMVSTACMPASGMSPASTVVANPDPQLTGPGLASPFVSRATPERPASELAATPAMTSKKKTLLLVGIGVAVAVLVIVLVSGGNGYSSTY